MQEASLTSAVSLTILYGDFISGSGSSLSWDVQYFILYCTKISDKNN